MLKNKNIICISSIDWDFVWQGHQEIMSTFARNGNRVLFIENTGVRTPTFKDIPRLKKRLTNWFKSVKGFKKESDNLFIYSPVVLPFPYSTIARWINKKLLLEPLKRWVRAMDFNDLIVWTFLPTGIALDIINELDARLLVYYYIADFDALTDKREKLKKTEEAVIKKCDVIFVQGEALREKCKKLGKEATIFPFGVNTEVFERFLSNPAKKTPEEIANVKRPIIGYIGGIHKHVDIALLRHMAEKHPDWSIVLVGPKQMDVSQVENIPNIVFLGQKKFSELPAYVFNFDVCTIPYVSSEYTKTVYPTKMNEYHIMGKPVVSTYLPEVESFNRANDNLVAMASTHEDFVELVKKALDKDDDALISKRIASARKNSWGQRVEGMSAIMEKAIEEKKNTTANWQDKFLLLYKSTKRGALKIVLAVALLWVAVFYTPIVWFIAEPLKMDQPPQKADAIIVLAGGVGESGKAGQGYEERVGYAVELYKQGYSTHLIFSSGYKSFFDETMLMKALAIALGVPDSAIILEDKARTTYEKMELTKEILDREKWTSALVISPAYHMRRVSLVANKLMSGITLIYTPLPHSSYYAHETKGIFSKKVSIAQIKAIAHEYLGIAYYWWRGWL